MTPRILLVEDDDSTRRSFLYLLRYANYHVREAADGETALELLSSERFDVVITDIILGGISGMDVLHLARQQHYRPEVIVLTGHGSFETAVLAVREGAFDYLVKPCASDELRATVARALQQHHTEQQVRTAAQTLMQALYGDGAASQARPRESDQSLPTSAPDTHYAPTIVLGALMMGPTRRDVTFAGHVVQLTHTEYMLLRYLSHHVGNCCASRDILRFTHGIETNEAEAQALVKPHIHNLRRKLHPSYVVTERGKGYRLVVPDGGSNV